MRKLQKRINPSRAGGESSEETKGMFRSWFLAVQTPLTTKRMMRGRGERGRDEREGRWRGRDEREGRGRDGEDMGGRGEEGRGSTRTEEKASLGHQLLCNKLHDLKAMQHINTSIDKQQTAGQTDLWLR